MGRPTSFATEHGASACDTPFARTRVSWTLISWQHDEEMHSRLSNLGMVTNSRSSSRNRHPKRALARAPGPAYGRRTHMQVKSCSARFCATMGYPAFASTAQGLDSKSSQPRSRSENAGRLWLLCVVEPQWAGWSARRQALSALRLKGPHVNLNGSSCTECDMMLLEKERPTT